MDDAGEIEDLKQMLRDLPQTVHLRSFGSLDELKSYWPIILSPTPDFCKRLTIYSYEQYSHQFSTISNYDLRLIDYRKRQCVLRKWCNHHH